MTTLTYHERTLHEAHLFAESLRAQKRLAEQIVAECGAHMQEFRLMLLGGLLAAGDGKWDTETPTAAEQASASYGTLDLSQGSTREWFEGIEEVEF